MKPKTYQTLCSQFFENVGNMDNDDLEHDQYEEMSAENDMIEQFMILEGRKKSFTNWQQRCYVEVQARADGI